MSTAATLTPPARFAIKRGVARKAHRTLLYGVPGIGKTSLAASLEGVVIVDIEGGAIDLDVPRVEGVTKWADLRSLVQSDVFDSARAICIDSVSKAEDFARQFVIDTVPAEKGARATSMESYGFGKGFTYLLEEWRRFLSDLERHYAAGRDVVLIGHANIGKTPNPSGDDYIRHEPRLYHGDKTSLRAITVDWCDHVLFANYDVAALDGKGKGSGTRTIYTSEQATHVAKSRTLPPAPVVFKKGDATVWDLIRNNQQPQAPEL